MKNINGKRFFCLVPYEADGMYGAFYSTDRTGSTSRTGVRVTLFPVVLRSVYQALPVSLLTYSPLLLASVPPQLIVLVLRIGPDKCQPASAVS